ncbi:MAG: isoprenylcysteine carboxylmethyltransferase family protein [Rhodospirillaceae bacterium]|nr:isoprenylcysteine carboxylmethyltransferase family protein [Rhodospirillaceae bacterium]MCY4238241.1 isoprenylcysteine carboxylmethyltransferase family protein [Rhodospirillaceae bacterium]
MTIFDHILFALAWISFGVVHSLLAREKANDLFDSLVGGFSRILYNLIAATHLAVILILEWRGFPGKTVFEIPLAPTILMVTIQVVGWFLLFVAIIQYDVGRFGGLTQAKVIVHRRNNEDKQLGYHYNHGGFRAAPMQYQESTADLPQAVAEPLVTHGIHRYVRHPMYAALFLVLWGRAFDETALMTAFWSSLYLVIGTRYEERKLLRIYGEDYARYMQAVPRFLSVRGRAWSE